MATKKIRTTLNKMPTRSALLAALEAQPNWKKVSACMAGVRVDDSASFSQGDFTFEAKDGEMKWESPFARVSLKFNVEVFDLMLTKCNNPGAESVGGLFDAVYKFATTAWHVGCRGVI